MATKRTPRPKPERDLSILYIGNFEAPHSTENHVARALESNGHQVTPIQENSPRMWDGAACHFDGLEATDLVLWTRTGWDYGRHGYDSPEEVIEFQRRFLRIASERGIPTVGYHLDLWHGLLERGREGQVDTEPFFKCDLVCTADGGSDEWFASKGVNHAWFPPGVSAPECEPGMFRDEFRSKLAFVGSWQGGYHKESRHRFELVRWLKGNYPNDCRFWPEEGRPAVRGADLRDLYASVDVVVGDSCLVGTGHANYWSDRVPETLGRGGLLLHPEVPGLREAFPEQSAVSGCPGLPWMWPAGEWYQLKPLIEAVLGMSSDARRAAGEWTRAYVLEHHTYEVRMRQLTALLREKGMLS